MQNIKKKRATISKGPITIKICIQNLFLSHSDHLSTLTCHNITLTEKDKEEEHLRDPNPNLKYLRTSQKTRKG